MRSPPLPVVVRQHAEVAVVLCRNRIALVDAPHVRLRHLDRLDERLEAHLDGLEIAGDLGQVLCSEALENVGAAELFAGAALALRGRDEAGIERFLALSETVRECRTGLQAAFVWSPADALRGVVRDLLSSPHSFRRAMGIAACNAHRIDPGNVRQTAFSDADPLLRAQALQAAGECGLRDAYDHCVVALGDEDPACAFLAARTMVLLGERHAAVHALHRMALAQGEYSEPAMALLLKLADPPMGAQLLQALVGRPKGERKLARGIALFGDPQFVPWLVDQMRDPQLTRIAGESFSTITGADLALLDLERKPPEGAEFGPNDNPEDDDVAMDEDDGLPWPDPERVLGWWDANAHRFQPGVRYFMGAPPSPAHCLQVLKEGYQRQRIAAAEYLCLLQPGSRLFPTSAPAWRQQRWLEQMGA